MSLSDTGAHPRVDARGQAFSACPCSKIKIERGPPANLTRLSCRFRKLYPLTRGSPRIRTSSPKDCNRPPVSLHAVGSFQVATAAGCAQAFSQRWDQVKAFAGRSGVQKPDHRHRRRLRARRQPPKALNMIVAEAKARAQHNAISARDLSQSETSESTPRYYLWLLDHPPVSSISTGSEEKFLR
jgi:hypothetical protein